ncbi:F-box protein CPR1-like [Impatiens glandulifera]|uniref:F-box protein CPR1-like n=1 Tax=Impatiens glandulifera TaxID=253017 RepID=UPI001FB115FD|nr:F-box protein CPR1-like [Impatiens glandulifera]
MTTFFPDEILENILSRLPVKCLLRLRFVSKAWFSLISSPYFVKLHLKRSVQNKSNLSLYITNDRVLSRWNFYSLDDHDHVLRPEEIVRHPLSYRKYTIQNWGSCDGLICLSNTFFFDDFVCLWNPSTNKSIKLPYTSTTLTRNDDRSYGFYYDITNDDYRVVRTTLFVGKIFDYEIKVYSLRSNSWHRLEKFHQGPNFNSKVAIACGALHWTLGEADEEKIWIVAFDLVTEKYRVISQPEYSGPPYLISLYNFEGCLSLSCHYYSNVVAVVDVWLLNEYGEKNEYWSKLVSLPLTEPTDLTWECSNFSAKPVAYSKSGKKVLLEIDCKKLVWYNLEQKSVEDIMLQDLEPYIQIHFYSESLVSLSAEAVTNAKKNSRRKKKMKYRKHR